MMPSPADVTDSGRAARPFDVIVLGASGVTGREVARHLHARAAATGLRWAAAGRDSTRTAAILQEAGCTDVPVFEAEVGDTVSLLQLAALGRVLVNCAGPFTRSASSVIQACITSGTSYVDPSGEIANARHMIARWHVAAQSARITIVQSAGFEALPADLATSVAIARCTASGDAAIRAVSVLHRIERSPRITRISDALSGGTMRSVLESIGGADAPWGVDCAALLPAGTDPSETRRRNPVRLAPRIHHGIVLGAAFPLAFVNPPVIHRTMAMRAEATGAAYTPIAFREYQSLGRATLRGSLPLLIVGGVMAGAQRLIRRAFLLPPRMRRFLSREVSRLLRPGSGSGSTNPRDWQWTVTATAVTVDGRHASARLRGEGHPGYLATGRMLGELAFFLARPGQHAIATGCVTPAIALGAERAHVLRPAGLVLDRVRAYPPQ